jgi:hypothetical protein
LITRTIPNALIKSREYRCPLLLLVLERIAMEGIDKSRSKSVDSD